MKSYLDEMLRSRNLNELNCSNELLLIVKIGGVTYLLLIKQNLVFFSLISKSFLEHQFMIISKSSVVVIYYSKIISIFRFSVKN